MPIIARQMRDDGPFLLSNRTDKKIANRSNAMGNPRLGDVVPRIFFNPGLSAENMCCANRASVGAGQDR